jgi:CRISPR-associated endonuclease Csn1
MKRWLVHRGVLSREDLDRPGHPAPFLLAAAALQGHRTLSAWELWTVLRWYAHNRGYDGNSRWARGEEEPEDTEKQANARSLMEKHGTATMAETVCACLGLKPPGHGHKISSELPYKTLNAAYHRGTVVQEVSRLLSSHLGKIPGLDPKTVRLMMSSDELGADARRELNAASIKLPKRYAGGLLFGQLVPRFDNRIIARCPVTWARTYDEAIASGKDDKEARHLADKFAKVPAAKTCEFLQYRFARILANIKADGRPLPLELRNSLWDLAQRLGSLTPGAIAKEIRSALGNVPTNLEAYFKIHPDSAEALVLDPAKAEVRKAEGKRGRLSPIWSLLPQATREHALAEWTRRRPVSLAALLDHAGSPPELIERLKAEFAGMKPKKGAPRFGSFDEFLVRTTVTPDFPTGRAPYARPVLKQVVAEVLAGHDPTKACRATDPENGEEKSSDGVLYDLGIPSSRVRQLQAERPIDRLTNNHLVRHRMLILDRLVDDMVREFCTGGNQVGQVVVEVARELKEFSGMTAKQIASELNSRLKDFKAAVAYLEKHAPDLEQSGGIIRKCRIAMDLGWHCPFTGESYDAYDLPRLEREHIIPYATRNTNALHALVLTWPEINRMKGKRTARQFIAEHEGKPVEGRPNLSLFTLHQYNAFVDGLDTKGHDDDQRRKKARKALLATNDFEDKELGFTDGQLTQSSQLMKLAMGALKEKRDATGKRVFEDAHIDPIPGPVTAEIRKSWKLTGTLALACPEIVDETGDVRPKNEIRGLTHLHHALDAATLALAAHYFPLRQNGKNQAGLIWQSLMKRRRSKEEKEFLQKLGIFDTFQRTRGGDHQTIETDVRLRDLDKPVKEALARSLAEGRVMQHLPADRSGVKAELTTWGVTAIEGEGEDARVHLRQRTSVVEDGKRKIATKTREERAGKLLGIVPKNGTGKLKEIKGAMIIGENYGIALDPSPVIIPFHDVPSRLAELKAANCGKPVRVLRNGMLIRLSNQGVRDGIWRINSIKASLTLDLSRPPVVGQPSKGLTAWREVSVKGVLKKGVELLSRRYTGYTLMG